MNRKALGRGIGALIPEIVEGIPEVKGKDIAHLKVAQISPNPYQPRADFDSQGLEELKESILKRGVIQPIVVRPFGQGYQLIMGERRLRATQDAGIDTIPAIVVEVAPFEDMMELSLIENIQREDLNPVEEAKAYRALIQQCNLTQEEVSSKVGKDRSTVANLLRLLRLPMEIQEAILSGQLSMGHARAILSLSDEDDQIELCRKTIKEELSVRKVEQLSKAWSSGARIKRLRQRRTKDPFLVTIEEELQRLIGTAVRISKRGKKGKIEIEFYGDKDLERVLEKIRGEA